MSEPEASRGITTLSNRYWGVDLGARLPFALNEDGMDVVVVRGEAARITAFLASEFPSFAGTMPAEPPSPAVTGARRKYLEQDCDLFEIRSDGQTVGVIIGSPYDWSSYYLRICAVLKRFRSQTLVFNCLNELLYAPLAAAGVERVIADASPANIAVTYSFVRHRYYHTGQQLTDRWGAITRYTKYLRPVNEALFHEKFVGIAPPETTILGKEATP